MFLSFSSHFIITICLAFNYLSNNARGTYVQFDQSTYFHLHFFSPSVTTRRNQFHKKTEQLKSSNRWRVQTHSKHDKRNRKQRTLLHPFVSSKDCGRNPDLLASGLLNTLQFNLDLNEKWYGQPYSLHTTHTSGGSSTTAQTPKSPDLNHIVLAHWNNLDHCNNTRSCLTGFALIDQRKWLVVLWPWLLTP